MYSDSRGDSGPCSGDIDYPQYKAQALVNGSKPDRGKRSVSFDASAVNTSAIDEFTNAKHRANCNDQQLGLPRWGDTGNIVVLGVNIHHPPGSSIHPMDTSWSREAATGTPFPLDRFLAGPRLHARQRRAHCEDLADGLRGAVHRPREVRLQADQLAGSVGQPLGERLHAPLARKK